MMYLTFVASPTTSSTAATLSEVSSTARTTSPAAFVPTPAAPASKARSSNFLSAVPAVGRTSGAAKAGEAAREPPAPTMIAALRPRARSELRFVMCQYSKGVFSVSAGCGLDGEKSVTIPQHTSLRVA